MDSRLLLRRRLLHGRLLLRRRLVRRRLMRRLLFRLGLMRRLLLFRRRVHADALAADPLRSLRALLDTNTAAAVFDLARRTRDHVIRARGLDAAAILQMRPGRTGLVGLHALAFYAPRSGRAGMMRLLLHAAIADPMGARRAAVRLVRLDADIAFANGPGRTPVHAVAVLQMGPRRAIARVRNGNRHRNGRHAVAVGPIGSGRAHQLRRRRDHMRRLVRRHIGRLSAAASDLSKQTGTLR